MKEIKIKTHSIIDIITNSSTEIFTSMSDKGIEYLQNIINAILEVSMSDKKCDDLFIIEQDKFDQVKKDIDDICRNRNNCLSNSNLRTDDYLKFFSLTLNKSELPQTMSSMSWKDAEDIIKIFFKKSQEDSNFINIFNDKIKEYYLQMPNKDGDDLGLYSIRVKDKSNKKYEKILNQINLLFEGIERDI